MKKAKQVIQAENVPQCRSNEHNFCKASDLFYRDTANKQQYQIVLYCTKCGTGLGWTVNVNAVFLGALLQEKAK